MTRFKRIMLSGAALMIPIIITVLVITFALGFISGLLDPVVQATTVLGVSDVATPSVIKASAVVVLTLMVFVIGVVAERNDGNGRISRTMEGTIERIPAVGSVYTSFSEMSELMLDQDTDSFQDVKLVEYPGKGSYTVAFLTATDPPDIINDATEHEDMVTLFMPMAPNPVMGGFVIHVSTERVIDVDMTVEQGIRSIVTSGVAVGGEENPEPGLSSDELADLGYGEVSEVRRRMNPAEATGPMVGSQEEMDDHERDEYRESVDPEHAGQPTDIEQREREREDEPPESDSTADGGPAAHGMTPGELADTTPGGDRGSDDSPAEGTAHRLEDEVDPDSEVAPETRDGETPQGLEDGANPDGQAAPETTDGKTPQDIEDGGDGAGS